MGLSLLQTAFPPQNRDLGSDPLGLTASQAPGLPGAAFGAFTIATGVSTGVVAGATTGVYNGPSNTGELVPPVLTTVVRLGPVSTGRHSAGAIRALPGCSSLREVQPLAA